MMPKIEQVKIEHIGQAGASWPKRLRRLFEELFASKYSQLLERELLQLRLERDRLFAELRVTQERLVEVLAISKGIPLRHPVQTGGGDAKIPPAIGPTTWQNLVAAEQEKIAREEAEEHNVPPKEN